MKKVAYSALSLFFFATLAVAVVLLTDVFFNRQTTFFERNETAIHGIVEQMENR